MLTSGLLIAIVPQHAVIRVQARFTIVIIHPRRVPQWAHMTNSARIAGLARRIAPRLWHGCPASRPGCARTALHSDQQTTDRHDPQRQFLQVTAPHHPLHGQVFPLLRALTKQGEDNVIIQLPSGATQQLPRRWTDQRPALPTPPVLPLWSVTSLRALLGILKQLQARPCPEKVPDGSTPTPVAHVLAPDPARADRAARRTAASSSARATHRRHS